ncbi:MAG: NlpC/P60 family protein, partial [Bacillota bacterium]|nr:NlpC/P60 family protein [Bacillota bacterium]
IDSSGLTYMCSRINGVQLPRSVEMQYKSGEVVVVTKKNKPKNGDLVFFSSDAARKDVAQVGIFIGNDEILIASKSKCSVSVSDMNSEYFKQRLMGIRRIF